MQNNIIGRIWSLIFLLIGTAENCRGMVYNLDGLQLAPYETITMSNSFYSDSYFRNSLQPHDAKIAINARAQLQYGGPVMSTYLFSVISKNIGSENWKCFRDGGLHMMESSDVVVHDNVFEEIEQNLATLNSKIRIDGVGMYFLSFVYCPPQSLVNDTTSVNFQGSVRMQNPHGYLPAELYPVYGFYQIVTTVICITVIVWSIAIFRPSHVRITSVQKLITICWNLYLIEVFLKYMSLYFINESGTWTNYPMTIGIVTFSTVRVVSLVTILVFVSIGYEVQHTVELGAHRQIGFSFLLIYAIAYAISCTGHQLYSNSKVVLSGILLELPVCVLNAYIAGVVLRNLNTLLVNGTDYTRHLVRYRLAIRCVFGCMILWYPIQIYILYMQHDRVFWRFSNILFSFPEIMYLLLLYSSTLVYMPSFPSNYCSCVPIEEYDESRQVAFPEKRLEEHEFMLKEN